MAGRRGVRGLRGKNRTICLPFGGLSQPSPVRGLVRSPIVTIALPGIDIFSLSEIFTKMQVIIEGPRFLLRKSYGFLPKGYLKCSANLSKSVGLIGAGSGHIPKDDTAADGLIPSNLISATASQGSARMFCAAVLLSGHCLFACEGSLQEFSDAWSWPARVRWNNSNQELVDDYGVLPDLSRRGDRAIWHTPAEPTYCNDGQQSPRHRGTSPHSYHLSGRR